MAKGVELLAPAGDWECLKTAFYFGADAVYLAGKQFGLRAFAKNFTLAELEEAAQYAHELKKRIYVTVNALVRQGELEEVQGYIRDLKKTGIDAVIFSDPALLAMLQEVGLEAHLSTQASTMNAASARFWHKQGVKRIVLARETSLAEMMEIRKTTPKSLELEAFIHGAMCVAYSGRCLLSSVFTGRSGNRGECAQPCRWAYNISEAGYPGEYFPIEEDERGTYVLNSKDLMMIEHIPELIQAGIASFKIEGRMKSAYYVGCVVNAYRKAIDAYLKDPAGYALDESLREDLELSATRQFTTGFYFGNPREAGQDIAKEMSPRSFIFCGLVTGKRDSRGLLPIQQRNRFFVGDTLTVLSPKLANQAFQVHVIYNEAGEQQEAAPHPQQPLLIDCPFDLEPGDMLRLKKEATN